MKLVPEEDRRRVWDLLRHRQNSGPVVKRDSFVRIRQGQYKGDVAYVPSSANSTLPPTTGEETQPLENDGDVEDDLLVLWLVPRVDLSFSTKSNDDLTRPSKRRRVDKKGKGKEVEHPKPTPFDPKTIRDILRRQHLADDPEYALVEHAAWKVTFMKRTFENGFERLRVYGIHAVKPIHRPSPEDVAPFVGFSESAVRITNAAYTRVGDRVRTKKNGDGKITSSTNSTFTVSLDTDGNTAEVGLGDFERLFELGEWVDIRLGPETGRSGAVVSIEGPYLTVADPDIRKMVCWFHRTE